MAVLTRVPFASGMLYNMDSVQFALGMLDFDVALHQPHPPGYYLYVLMGRAANHIAGDANTALVSLSVLFGGLCAVMLYVLGCELFGRRTGVTAAVFGITSPLLWFHGEVALSYMPEAFMSLLVAWLCLRVIRGDARYAVPASVALALAGGIRQNTMVFLMPLWLFAMYRAGHRYALVCLPAFSFTVAAWFVPMIAETGGYARYSAALSAHWTDSNWRGIHLHWIAFNAKYMSYYVLSGLVLALVPIADTCIGLARGRVSFPPERGTVYFFTLWLVPAFLFHLIIFTHPTVPGHSLIYLVGLLILAARAVEYTAERISRAARGWAAERIHAGLVAFVAAFNTVFFLTAPYPLSARGIAEHDRVLSTYINAVRSEFSPYDTIIIGTDRFLYSYRHAMYYLPEFKVYDTVLLTTPKGPMLLWGKDRKTKTARRIDPSPGTRRFVDFLNYNASVDKSFPPGARVTDIGEGSLLVHYDSAGELAGIKRVAPLLQPAP